MKKWLLVLLSAAGLALLAGRWTHDAARDRGRALLLDRVWIDHLPRSDTDTVQIFAALGVEPVGIVQATSMWKGAYELFRYQAPGDGQLAVRYPQSGQQELLTYRAWACGEGRFDFCLDLRGERSGNRRYYSKRGWEIQATPATALHERVNALLAQAE